MATIRDVVEALHKREGVDAVLVVGRDGLAIDSHARDGVDTEGFSALLPSVLRGIAELGAAGGRGLFGAAILEFGAGLAVVAVLNPEATLVVLVARGTNAGAILFDLQRHRAALAGLF